MFGQTPADCPATLATIDKGSLSLLVVKTLGEIYQELGCRVRFMPYPGRRGIASFNNKQVNGEVMRIEKVERAYKRDFVRSSVPLMMLNSSLWQHPDSLAKADLPIGYTLGIIWQENYIKNKRGRKFSNAQELFRAYNSGELSGFLSADITVKIQVENGEIIPRPIQKQTVISAPLYHYLGQEFTPFMKRFSDLLQREDRFGYISEF
ncbi:hypothetical protein [Kiloniella sp.]|uniref:hypothetical protein n=1 Tax=Kiloniella sp. TaxID=1938587 RepID=UPI003B017296